jgi:Cellulose binding domain
MNADPRGRPYGTHGPSGPSPRQRPGARSRRTWYLAIASAAVLGLAAGGLALLAGGNGAPKHQLASDCGLINCGASLPSPAVTVSTQSRVSKAHTGVSHAPAAPKQSAPPSPVPLPSQAPTSAPPAPPSAANVAVSFMPDRDRHDFSHFQDQMTLVNQGGSPVSGWTVQLTLPGDGVDSVENQGGWDGVPFEHWQFSGDTLTISADTDSETLGPGAPLNLSIHGWGDATSPTGCTFNGAACALSTSGQQSWPQDQPSGQPDQPSGQPDQPSGQPDQPSQLAGADQAGAPSQPAGPQTPQRGWHDQRRGEQDQQAWGRYGQRSWGDQPQRGWRR